MSLPLSSSAADDVLSGHNALVALSVLDVDLQGIYDALRAGAHARRSASKHHPRIAGGFGDWAETVAVFRASQARKGWESSDPMNAPITTRPDGAVTISVCGGNDVTGRAVDGLALSRSHGLSAKKAVNENQMSLFDAGTGSSSETGASSVENWLLMHYRDGDQISVELALPVQMTSDGQVTGWRKRLILPPVSLVGDVKPRDGNEGDTGDEVEFPVLPR